ncbi:hypothetical protein D3C77_698990 [compost metagenome]
MFLEHGDGQPGTMHPLFALLLDEAVIHDDRHFPAQRFHHGILIDGLQSGDDPLQVILLQNPLTQTIRHALARQG